MPWPSSTTLSTHRCALADHKHSRLSLPRVSDSSRSDTGGVVVRAGGLAQHAVGSPPWNGRRHPALRPLGAEELCSRAVLWLRLECDSPRLCRRMTRRDASWRCSACAGWPVRPPPSARAPRRSASAASAPRRPRFLRSRAVAQLGSIRGSTSCLCSGQWAARLRLCVCVSCAVCAHASPVGSLCVRAPVSYQSSRTASGLIHHAAD